MRTALLLFVAASIGFALWCLISSDGPRSLSTDGARVGGAESAMFEERDDLVESRRGSRTREGVERDGEHAIAEPDQPEVPPAPDERTFGSLTLTAVGPEGLPIEGLACKLEAFEGAGVDSRSHLEGTTRSDGRVGFDPVDSSIHLSIEVGDEVFDGVDEDGVLVSADAQVGGVRPIVVRASETTEVTYRADRRVLVRGRVVEPDGEPAQEARLRVSAIDEETAGTRVEPRAATTKADGSFELLVTTRGPGARIAIEAQSTLGERASYSPFGGTVFPDPLSCGWVELDLASWNQDSDEALVQLETMGKLTGQVLGPDGAVAGRVDMVIQPMGNRGPFDFKLVSGKPTRALARAGSFTFSGVPPGAYSLEARSPAFGVARISGVAHDAKDVVLRFDQARAATIDVHVESTMGVASITVAHADLQLSRHLMNLDVLPRRSTYRAPLGAPSAALRDPSTSTQLESAGLRGAFGLHPAPGDRVSLNVAPGDHWIVVRAIDTDGRELFPAGTGPIRIEAGTHELTFRLLPTANVEGRINRMPVAEELRVEVHLPGGVLVPCATAERTMRDFVRVGTDGQFAIASVPSGEFEIWIGTREELINGSPRGIARQVVLPDTAVRVEF